MPDPGDRAEPEHHFVVCIEHRNEPHQGPEQRGAVVLPRLRIGPERARLIVADHDDEAATKDREQCLDARVPADSRPMVAMQDGTERAVDVTEMRLVRTALAWIEAASSRAGSFMTDMTCFGQSLEEWRAEGLGSFSAIPSVSARRCISFQTTPGSTPAWRQSATRW
jgi:hypothetical protein